MDAHAGDGLRLAGLAVNDPMEMRRCRAQATSMARQAESAVRTLLRIQDTREKQLAEMHPPTMERAGYWFRDASAPEPAPSREPTAAAPPAPPSATQSADAEPEPTQANIDAEAERYAVIYPDRAARIRAAGGLPARLDFGPPEPQIVAALLRSAGHPASAPEGRDDNPSHAARHGLVKALAETDV
jgi:hypothetical protein